jgi:hypothetical protein
LLLWIMIYGFYTLEGFFSFHFGYFFFYLFGSGFTCPSLLYYFSILINLQCRIFNICLVIIMFNVTASIIPWWCWTLFCQWSHIWNIISRFSDYFNKYPTFHDNILSLILSFNFCMIWRKKKKSSFTWQMT